MLQVNVYTQLFILTIKKWFVISQADVYCPVGLQLLVLKGITHNWSKIG